MENSKWTLLVVVGLLLLITGMQAGNTGTLAEHNSKQDSQRTDVVLERTGVYIANYASVDIKFELSSDGVNWYTYSLHPNYYSTYTFNGKAFGYVRLTTTGEGTVQYKLQNDRKYQISWNDSKRRWDIFLL